MTSLAILTLCGVCLKLLHMAWLLDRRVKELARFVLMVDEDATSELTELRELIEQRGGQNRQEGSQSTYKWN